MDKLTPKTRSALMSRIRGKDTSPELAVRESLRRLGFSRRYRLHRKSLPGTPDIVLPSLGKAIQVFGCFWHSHGCGNSRIPINNRAFWMDKLARNRERDKRATALLSSLGWEILVVWECQTRDGTVLDHLLNRFLSGTAN